MNKHITLATCCLLLISTQAVADRPAMSERTEIFEPEEVDISTSSDHRPAAEAVNEAASSEDNTEVEAAPEKEPVIRVYNHTTDTEVTGDVIELQPDGTLPVQVLDFPRRGMNMEKVKNELGQPLVVSPAVGTPPITRWTYSDRIVYFEYSSVVHVVAVPLKQLQDLILKESPLQRLESPLLTAAGVQLHIKREDLVDFELGGNKWRKLKYNLIAAAQQNHDTLLTFGGAYSNHIYATAAAGMRLGLRTIGLIRGEPHSPLNPTLQFAVDCGMQLEYIDRSRYRGKAESEFIDALKAEHGCFYLLPEGGSNALAVKGCAEIVEEIEQNFDFICSACGTGATLAGLISGLKEPQKAIGFAVLKGAGFLRDEIENFLQLSKTDSPADWQLNTDYHFGGYAKTTPELWAFIEKFKQDFDIPLDGVYTGKMFYGLFDLIQQGHFPAGSRIVAVHTGGVQGNLGFSQKHL